MANRPLAIKDNASGLLNAGISAAAGSIALQSGNGANFPVTARASATSGGTGIALNDTGIAATLAAGSFVVGDFIENVTDGSYAIILSIATDAIVTTPLVGGSDNTWQNNDVWACGRFMVTLIQFDTDGVTVLKREKVLIGSRTSDTLTVETLPSTGRGSDGSSAQSFLTGDHCYQLAVSVQFRGIHTVLSDTQRTIKTLADLVATKITNTSAEIFASSATGTDAYSATPSAGYSGGLANGVVAIIKHDVANVTDATLNYAATGVKKLLKENGTALATGDVAANSVHKWVYNTSLDAGSGAWSHASPVDVSSAIPVALTNGTDAGALHFHLHKSVKITRDMTTASGAVTTAHGLGRTPKFVWVRAIVTANGNQELASSDGTYDGTTNQCISAFQGTAGTGTTNSATQAVVLNCSSGTSQVAVMTFDGTNITLTWTKGGSPTGTAQLLFTFF